jgi:hypothetical protein
MKHLTLLLISISMLPGCKFFTDTAGEKPIIQAPPLKISQQTRPVKPEEITPSNAKSKAQQLLDELENDN